MSMTCLHSHISIYSKYLLSCYLMIPNTCITFEWLFVQFTNSYNCIIKCTTEWRWGGLGCYRRRSWTWILHNLIVRLDSKLFFCIVLYCIAFYCIVENYGVVQRFSYQLFWIISTPFIWISSWMSIIWPWIKVGLVSAQLFKGRLVS